MAQEIKQGDGEVVKYEDHIEVGLKNIHRYKYPFNHDNFISKKVLDLKEKYGLKKAVETGSFSFVTSEFFAANFEEFVTFEKSKKLFDLFSYKVKKYPNAACINKDSVQGMREHKKFFDDNTLFYLDAHWDDVCPLEEELQVIAECGIKPVIVIHDFKVPNKDWYYYQHKDFDLDAIYVKPMLEKIYGKDGYWLHYLDHVGINRVGSVFITKR